MNDELRRKQHFLFCMYMAGGNATIFRNLQSFVAANNAYRSSWIPVEMDPGELITKIPPISLNGSLRNSVAARIRIRSLERAGSSFDAAYYFQQTIITFLPGLRKRIPFVLAMDSTPLYCARRGFWYAHPEFDPESRVAKVKKAITQRIYNEAYRLLPLSRGVRDSLIEDYGVDPNRIEVVPPGIDLSLWRSHKAGKSSARPRVLFVGAAFRRKGGHLLAQLAQMEEFRTVDFHFVTNDYSGPRSHNIAIHSDLSPNDAQLIQLYHDSDIFVLPTFADTYSIASLEAMASAVPVITSRVGGIEDIVTHGRDGYLIAPGDEKSLAELLRTLVRDEELRRTIGCEAQRTVTHRYNIERIASRCVEFLIEARHHHTHYS